MRAAVVVSIAVGCGGATPSPPPVPPPAPKPIVRVVRPAPRIEPISCRDVAIILRGPSENDESALEREKVIETTCAEDGWSQKLLDCIGEKPAKHEACLEQLSPEHRQAYDERVAATKPKRHLDCEGNLGRVEAYDPSLDIFAGSDRALLLQLRRDAVEDRCRADAWDQAALQCFSAGRDPLVCRALLSRVQEDALVAALAPLQTLGQKIVAAQQRPAQLACKALAAQHYSDRAWVGKEPALKGAARKKAIEELRTWLVRSCNDESWSVSVRACVSTGAMPTCMRGTGSEARWDFTPLATPFGIAECDQFAKAISNSLRCDKVKQSDLREILDEARGRVSRNDPRDETVTLCDDGLSDLTERMNDAGCKP